MLQFSLHRNNEYNEKPLLGSFVLFCNHDPAGLIRDLWDVRGLTIEVAP